MIDDLSKLQRTKSNNAKSKYIKYEKIIDSTSFCDKFYVITDGTGETSDGVVFHYSKYEMAAGAYTVNFTISKDVIRQYVSPIIYNAFLTYEKIYYCIHINAVRIRKCIFTRN